MFRPRIHQDPLYRREPFGRVCPDAGEGRIRSFPEWDGVRSERLKSMQLSFFAMTHGAFTGVSLVLWCVDGSAPAQNDFLLETCRQYTPTEAHQTAQSHPRLNPSLDAIAFRL